MAIPVNITKGGAMPAAATQSRKAEIAKAAAIEFEGDGGVMLAALDQGPGFVARAAGHHVNLRVAAGLLKRDHHQLRQACVEMPEAMLDAQQCIHTTAEFFEGVVALLRGAEARVMAGLCWASEAGR